MKQTIRTFALGLLTATTALGVTYYMEEPSSEPHQKQLTLEDMMTEVEKQGYAVLSNQELTALENDSSPREAPKNSEKEDEEIPETEKVYVYSLDIVQGTTSDDISRKLAQAGIIEKASELEQYMAVNDYSRFIQVGQATIDSDMTLNEIAKAITSK
ncbi:hypothetical protein H0266_01645 [Halobacillus locisalis]|uniref:YceG-like family protein n=1 Tax=Halobacillus locisalis TaxID=220753 RepID=A0A838CNJ3_9BACI|nr:hypothetical protein [Halobacillus locisalis]MBA2173590.1 hypothetical protein [Halobacillus locisalis]